ncbi:MAG: hypothetical protein QNJ72_35960 [Pleurocapsa sp. MO_226.B13]|nr:hypothetical protein [Pleurocapsa sp. MO_226.B13]
MIIIDTAIAIKGYILAVYYCSDQFYRLSIIGDRGEVFDFNDIFYCEKIAINRGKAIIRTIA